MNKPLPGYTPPVITSQYPTPVLPADIMTRSSDSHMSRSFDHMTNSDEPKPTPSATPPSTSLPKSATPPTGRREFVPQRITLENLRGTRMYRRPLTFATGLVNTVSDILSQKVKISSSRDPREVGVVNSREELEEVFSDDDDDLYYEVSVVILLFYLKCCSYIKMIPIIIM